MSEDGTILTTPEAAPEAAAPEAAPAAEDWSASLPEDLREPAALAKAYTDLKGKVPTVPEAPEGYDIEVPEGFDKASVQKLAHEAGLSKEQAQALVNYRAGEMARQTEAYKAAQAQWVEQIKADWPGEQFTQNVAHAKKALAKFDPAGDAAKLLDATGYGSHPVIVKLFAAIGKGMSEPEYAKGEPAPPPDNPAKVLYPNMA